MPKSVTRTSKRRPKLPKGLTLIEVMIAMAIFSLGILAVTAMQTSGVRGLTASRQRLCNTVAAADLLEQALLQTSDALIWQAGEHGPLALPQGTARIVWKVQEDFPVPGARHIRVRVEGLQQNGRRQHLAFDYLKAQNF